MEIYNSTNAEVMELLKFLRAAILMVEKCVFQNVQRGPIDKTSDLMAVLFPFFVAGTAMAS